MATTERDLLELRLARIEESLHTLERRVDGFEHPAPLPELPPPVMEPAAEKLSEIPASLPAEALSDAASDSLSEEPLIDFTLIGKSILIVGGAYLLRAFTELH